MSPNGTITRFDPLGSTYTQPNAINPAGTVTGYFEDASFVAHGFLRTSDGTITVFDPPGSLFTYIPGGGAMNPAGTVAGSFTPPNFSGANGFVVRLKNMQ